MINPNGCLIIAFQRLGRGILGTWCVVGIPILIFGFSYGNFETPLVLLALVLVAATYATTIWKWRRQGTAFIRAVGIDTILVFVFTGVAGLIGALVPGANKVGSALWFPFSIFGFWILEKRKLPSLPPR